MLSVVNGRLLNWESTDPTKHFLISNCRIHLRAETMSRGARGGWAANFVTDPFDGIAMPQGPPSPAPAAPSLARRRCIFISKFPLEGGCPTSLSSLTFTFLCSVAWTLIASYGHESTSVGTDWYIPTVRIIPTYVQCTCSGTPRYFVRFTSF